MQDDGITKPHANSFDCFMGKWQGESKTFGIDGEVLAATPVYTEMAWKDDKTFTLLENIQDLYQIGKVSVQSVIHVSGKTASAKTEHLNIQATALAASTFLFRVKSSVSKTTLHNTHYFIDKNTRCVVTHKFKDDQTFVFQFQKFVRVT